MERDKKDALERMKSQHGEYAVARTPEGFRKAERRAEVAERRMKAMEEEMAAWRVRLSEQSGTSEVCGGEQLI